MSNTPHTSKMIDAYQFDSCTQLKL